MDFAAIDFETANECPSSVCSVGVVIVRDGRIVDTSMEQERVSIDQLQSIIEDKVSIASLLKKLQ